MAKATTVRFTDEVYQRLDQASARTGMPVNSIVVAACLEWMQRHMPEQVWQPPNTMNLPLPAAPRWATIRRAIRKASQSGAYPFERFSERAKKLLVHAQEEAEKHNFSYIGTEQLLLACFADQEFQSRLILDELGIDESIVREAVEKAIAAGKPHWTAHMAPTSGTKRVIETAFSVCAALGHPRVSTGHILLALSTAGGGIGAQVLADNGVTPERIEPELRNLTDLEV
jgi:hypothetical protein